MTNKAISYEKNKDIFLEVNDIFDNYIAGKMQENIIKGMSVESEEKIDGLKVEFTKEVEAMLFEGKNEN